MHSYFHVSSLWIAQFHVDAALRPIIINCQVSKYYYYYYYYVYDSLLGANKLLLKVEFEVVVIMAL